MKILEFVIYATAVALLSGCSIHPYYGKRQPPVAVTVLDSKGRPLDGAKVHIIVIDDRDQRIKNVNLAVTDSRGKARFYSRLYNIGQAHNEAEIRTQKIKKRIADIHFRWCIERKAYATHVVRERFADASKQNRVFRLRPGRSTRCPGVGAKTVHTKS